MAKFDVTLPEISVETFEHAWLRFELAATAKEWQEDKQLRTLPTLLRSKLVEYFVELSSEEKSSLEGVKAALTKRAGVIGYTVRPNFRSGGPYSLREYGPPRTQLPREYGPPDRVPWLYKTN